MGKERKRGTHSRFWSSKARLVGRREKAVGTNRRRQSLETKLHRQTSGVERMSTTKSSHKETVTIVSSNAVTGCTPGPWLIYIIRDNNTLLEKSIQ